MKLKKVLTFIIGAIILAVAYWLLSPLWKNTRVEEAFPIPVTPVIKTNDGAVQPLSPERPVTESTVSVIRATGTFAGFDILHNGSGTVNLISDGTDTYIRFESDFKVTNGPDLYVGFGKDGKYIESAELARLKGNQGSQNYLVPSTVDLSQYNEVWIWCKAFSVPFARAILK